MRTVAALLLASGLVSGCAGGPMGLGGTRPPDAIARELFSYERAADGHLRVEVDQVIMAGQPDFIPSDPNWLQLRVTVTNTGERTLSLTSVQEVLEDGLVLSSAQSAGELIEPPNLVREGLITTGVGAAGMAVGYLLFPPAAILGGALIAFRPMFEGDRVGRMAERLNRESLRVGAITPGASVRGWVFVPAVRGQAGLVVVYEVGGSTESLTLPRREAGTAS